MASCAAPSTCRATSPRMHAKAAALALPTVVKALEGKAPRKTIVVPNRIVNVVV